MKKGTSISVVVVIEEDGDGFHAYAPDLRGLHVYGTTEKDALENAKDAVSLYLESLSKHGEPLPEGLTVIEDNKSMQHVTLTWPFHNQPGTRLETALPAT